MIFRSIVVYPLLYVVVYFNVSNCMYHFDLIMQNIDIWNGFCIKFSIIDSIIWEMQNFLSIEVKAWSKKARTARRWKDLGGIFFF